MFAEQGNESPFDNNTLPSPSSSWPTERYMEAVALAKIIDDVM